MFLVCAVAEESIDSCDIFTIDEVASLDMDSEWLDYMDPSGKLRELGFSAKCELGDALLREDPEDPLRYWVCCGWNEETKHGLLEFIPKRLVAGMNNFWVYIFKDAPVPLSDEITALFEMIWLAGHSVLMCAIAAELVVFHVWRELAVAFFIPLCVCAAVSTVAIMLQTIMLYKKKPHTSVLLKTHKPAQKKKKM